MSQVNWGKKPSSQQPITPAPDLDSLVRGQKRPDTRRLNLNIPSALHSRIKAQCALDGRDMTEALIEILEARFPSHR
jgi:hypothetical protein